MQDNEPLNAAALIKELDSLGCKIVLKDGGPVIRGNKAAITPDLLDLLKAGREQIIEYLTAQDSPDNEVAPPEDIAARFYVEARPAKTDNRLTGNGPCSACGFTLWWRRVGDTSEGWTCSVCHPAPPTIATVTPDDLAEPHPLKESA